LAHDASTKPFLGYTKIGRVTIGDRVFIGAGSIVLPDVVIGNDVVIGAGSVVTHDIPDNSVFVGNPARRLCSLDEYLDKERSRMKNAPIYGVEYTMGGKINRKMKKQQKQELNGKIGFVV
jgi:maltose O-acetyltransferase